MNLNLMMNGKMHFRFVWLLVLAVSCAFVCGLAAADGDTDDAAKKPFVVRDVSIYLLDAFGNQLNDKELFESTFPPAANPKRKPARDKADHPSPVGLITFSGEPVSDIDVLLDPAAGQGLATWPRANLKRKRILWEDLELVEKRPETEQLIEREWLSPLREANSLYAQLGKESDRFLLYS